MSREATSRLAWRAHGRMWMRGLDASARVGIKAWAALLVTLSIPAASRADQVDLAAQRDNTLYEEGNLSNGAGDHFFTGRTDQPNIRRGLIQFDVAGAVPPGSTITSVTLSLYCSRTKTQNENVALHRVLADWGEGTSNAPQEEGTGAPAATGDATWLYRFYDSSLWTTAGGSFANSASASTVVGGQNSYYAWSSNGMVADVQAWLDSPGTNFGWIVIGNETGQKVTKRFDSRSHPDAAKRPLLSIVYTPPTSQTGACCAVDGGCTVVRHPGSTCTASYMGADTSCSPNPCPQPVGACCLPNSTATCSSLTAAQCTGQGGGFQGALTSCAPNPCPVVLTPFLDALPRPPVATPVSGVPGGAASYALDMVEFSQKLHAELPSTRVWGFDDGTTGGSYPGPTIEASSQLGVNVVWGNDLRDADGLLRTQHYLPVDTCLDGAIDASPRTVVHLHGGHVPAAVDGYPEATLLPGEQVSYAYPNRQDAATLWYHDHALGITRLNVYMGLAGFYLVRSAEEQALGLPAGEYEVPLAIQDRTFKPDGSLKYPATWMEHFFGDTILVNGKAWPYLDVRKGKYRFRVLNGSNSRTYTLSLSSGAAFQQIGGDGGLFTAPVTTSEVTLGSGERADLVIDFSGYPTGTEIVLTNSATAPFPAAAGVGVIPNVMKFRVVGQVGHTAAIAATLRVIAPLSPAQAVTTRDFVLDKSGDPCTGSKWLINGLGWHTLSEMPELGTTEIWRFVNTSGAMHPMHMHLVFFQVLDRQPFELVGGVVVPIGEPVPASANEGGWKDTVRVGVKEIVRVIARFEDYVGKYPYHCHILEHEDQEMMRQFQTTTTCGDGARGEPQEECDDGNPVDGDGCDTNCTQTACGNGIVTSGESCDPPSSCPTSCNDNNGCTTDQLTGAAVNCTATCSFAPITCSAIDECHGAGSCNPSTGACSTPALPNGTGCDDGDACTTLDSCQSGACTGGSPVTCSAIDECHGSGSCNPSTGACSTPALPNGTRCDDGDACTTLDSCQSGTCTGSGPVTCSAIDECHGSGSCNPSTGACSTPTLPNGTGCDDGDACTTLDSCQSGTCTGGSPVTCSAIDECHGAGNCNSITGLCSMPVVLDGTPCALGHCFAGVCLPDGAGTDAGVDAGADAGRDAGGAVDAGADAGRDAGGVVDAGADAGIDAGHAVDGGTGAAGTGAAGSGTAGTGTAGGGIAGTGAAGTGSSVDAGLGDASTPSDASAPTDASRADAATDAGTRTEQGGCSCRIAAPAPPPIWAFVAIGFLAAWRRQRGAQRRRR